MLNGFWGYMVILLWNSSEAIINWFEMAGIKEALEMEFPSEDSFADLDS